MFKKIFDFFRHNNSSKTGDVLALTLFIVALLILSVSAISSMVLNNLNFSGFNGDAANAARTCLAQLDYTIGSTASGTNPFSSCTAGQAFVLNGSTCVNDLSDSASTTLALGNNCSCAVFFDASNTTSFSTYSSGRCWTTGNTRTNPSTEVIIAADVATGTPGCVPSCPAPLSVAPGGSCNNGCGVSCGDGVCSGPGSTCQAGSLTCS